MKEMLFLRNIDYALLIRDNELFESLEKSFQRNDMITDSNENISTSLDDNEKEMMSQLIVHTRSILEGRHMDIIQDSTVWKDELAFQSLLNCEADEIQQIIIDYICSQETELLEYISLAHCMVLGLTYFELFMQMNYTGPELCQAHYNLLVTSKFSMNEILLRLECDGNLTFPIVDIPQSLVIARSIISTICNPQYKLWKHGVKLDSNGNILFSMNERSPQINRIEEINNSLNLYSTSTYAGRMAMIHARLLQKQHYSNLPTLWKESSELFQNSIEKFNSIETLSTQQKSILLCLIYIEWGLCCHHFDYKDKGKASFNTAKDIIGLTTNLTGALGRRTKFQQFDVSQLYLQATSSLVSLNSNNHHKIQGKELKLINEKKMEDGILNSNPNAWKHAEWELGKRLVGEVEGGEEAAVREVMLDSIDGGPEENILLEGGPKFTEEIEKGSLLHPVDQLVLLSLCLDVSNSNPTDGLTAEEMSPYLERVLQQAQNWMIHSTGLLERSWLEFERRRTFDRALLQIQALLDQHTTKLTIMQSTYKAVEESAPVQDRIKYINNLVYPAQYELKRDLAIRYLKSQVFVSALNLFKELGMWDEVVQCYQLMDKPQRAELVVREQLLVNETPYMLTALADLTRNESLYEKAWILSKNRYPRAKRTLARICYDKGDFLACIQHLDQALAIHPLVATAWYLRGIASMQVQDWNKSIESFIRCVQQDMEVAEAYANMGAVYMRMKEFSKAYSSLKEAIKYRSDSWKIGENLLLVCLALGKWKEAIIQMDWLLNLHKKSERPVHKQELRYIINIAIDEYLENNNESTIGFIKMIEDFLKKLLGTIYVDSEVWDIISEFYEKLQRPRDVIDCRMKECRTAMSVLNWEKDSEKIQGILDIVKKLLHVHSYPEINKSDLYICRALIQSIISKLENEYLRLSDDTSKFNWYPILQDYYKTLDDWYNSPVLTS